MAEDNKIEVLDEDKAKELLEMLAKEMSMIQYQNPRELLEWHDFDRRELYIGEDIEPFILQSVGYMIRKYNQFDDDMGLEYDSRKPIMIFCNSNGGVLKESMAIVDLINASRTPVYTIIMGKAHSSCALIAIAGHKRFAHKHSEMLLHDGHAGVMNSTSKVFDTFSNLKRQETEVKKHVLEHSCISSQQYTSNYTKEWYLNAEEMIRYKLVDYIVDEII